MNKKFSLVMITIWSVIALLLIGLLVTFLVLGSSSRPFAWNFGFNRTSEKYTQYVNKSFDSSGINNLKVKVTSADVSFSKAQGSEIKVAISGNNSDESKKDMYTVAQNGSTLEITQNYEWWNYISFFNFGNYGQRISITLPESYKKDLDLSLTSGEIRFDGDYTLAAVGIQKTSGDLIAGSIKADQLTFKTTSGNTNIAALDAKYDITSTSGDTRINALSGSGRIHSTSGRMTFDIAKLGGDVDISATSGDMRIGLAKGINANITASTTSGDVSASFPLSYSGKGRRHCSATLGTAPYNNLSVSVLSGDVDFTQK